MPTTRAPVTTLTVIAAARRAEEPCCPADACRYSPERVRRFIKTIRDLRGICSPIEAVRSVHLGRCLGPQLGHTDNTNPGNSSESAANVVADLVRSIQAGKRDPTSIAAYLCPMRNPLPVDETLTPEPYCSPSGKPMP